MFEETKVERTLRILNQSTFLLWLLKAFLVALSISLFVFCFFVDTWVKIFLVSVTVLVWLCTWGTFDLLKYIDELSGIYSKDRRQELKKEQAYDAYDIAAYIYSHESTDKKLFSYDRLIPVMYILEDVFVNRERRSLIKEQFYYSPQNEPMLMIDKLRYLPNYIGVWHDDYHIKPIDAEIINSVLDIIRETPTSQLTHLISNKLLLMPDRAFSRYLTIEHFENHSIGLRKLYKLNPKLQEILTDEDS